MSEEAFNHLMTNEQCLKLVEKSIKTNQFQLLNYTLKPLDGEKKGFLATHLKGTFYVKCKEKIQTLKFFMKLKLDANDTVAKLANNNDVYTRESTFLKLVTNDFHVNWAPKFYDYIDNKLIVLEDLSERGFKLADSEEYDLNHCYVGLKALANFHAFSFLYLHKKRLENKDYSILKEHPDFFIEFLFTTETETGRKYLKSSRGGSNFLIDQIQPKNVEKIKMKFNERYDSLIEQLKPKDNKYHVISHGDLWANNIMFSYENNLPKECCVIDYQQLRYISPTFDVQFFLSVNTTPNFRAKHYHNLLEYYYQQLSQELNTNGLDSQKVYPKEIFKNSCTETNLQALISACTYKTFLLMPRHKMTALLSHPVIAEDVMYGNRTKYIQEELETNDVYKGKIFQEFQVLINEIETLL